MNTLGISADYHASACCLLQDGRLVAAAEEEGFHHSDEVGVLLAGRGAQRGSRPGLSRALSQGTGQQQLVGVARAIVAKPSLILADEPTGNRHSDQGREIMELFQGLNREGTTIIQATHSKTNAAYGHRVVRLRDGWFDG
jgi:ABC-type lipoprotein export system ATPase subunit